LSPAVVHGLVRFRTAAARPADREDVKTSVSRHFTLAPGRILGGMNTNPKTGVALVLAAAALWGTTGTAQSFTTGAPSPLWFGTLRLMVWRRPSSRPASPCSGGVDAGRRARPARRLRACRCPRCWARA
jgi:hypothetical protein